MRILGFMSGTSLDAVDMAVLETDGETIQTFGPADECKLSAETRTLVLAATAAAKSWARGTPEPLVFAAASEAVAEEHFRAARGFMAANGITAADLDLVGFHGQTVLHERPTPARIGRTVQLGDGALLARRLGVPVAFDFRTADVAAGGEGAPLAPIYHAARARASGIAPPVAILNLGGVANITLIPSSGAMLAYDTGPANGIIDLWVQSKTDLRFDPEGRLAAAGRVDEDALAALLSHPYFASPGPKSLDRYDFPMTPVEGLSLEDGAATLVAFTAETVALAVRAAAEVPKMMIAAGGGRLNPVLMAAITARAGAPVINAEALGWRGDSIEAEAFAYLAARTMHRLPISFPGTTGVKAPMTGGRIVWP
jgi:anhydro-N-acetylmuramic acid kinase